MKQNLKQAWAITYKALLAGVLVTAGMALAIPAVRSRLLAEPGLILVGLAVWFAIAFIITAATAWCLDRAGRERKQG